MKTFRDRFKDTIDMTDGTVVLTEAMYKSIQRDTLKHAKTIVNNNGEYGLNAIEIADRIDKTIDLI